LITVFFLAIVYFFSNLGETRPKAIAGLVDFLLKIILCGILGLFASYGVIFG